MSDQSNPKTNLTACIDRIYARLSKNDAASDDIIRQEATRAKLSIASIETILRLDRRFTRSSGGWKVQPNEDRWPEMAMALPSIMSTSSDARSLFRQVVVELDASTQAHFNEYYPAEFSEGLQHKITQLITGYSPDSIDQSKGSLFDLVMSELFDNSEGNRFFTPRPICKIVAAWVQPQIGDKVIDPCCGSGGFLLAIAQQIDLALSQAGVVLQDQSTLFETSYAYKMNLDRSEQKDNLSVINKMIFGIDVDVTAAWSGKTNLALHGFDEANMQQADALDLHQSPFPLESFEIVIGNPSFFL